MMPVAGFLLPFVGGLTLGAAGTVAVSDSVRQVGMLALLAGGLYWFTRRG